MYSEHVNTSISKLINPCSGIGARLYLHTGVIYKPSEIQFKEFLIIFQVVKNVIECTMFRKI